jgi:hypothetical protein
MRYVDGPNPLIGVAEKDVATLFMWNSAKDFRVWYNAEGVAITSNNARVPYGAGSALVNGDYIGVALDCDNWTIEFFRNGTGLGKLPLNPNTYYPVVADPWSGVLSGVFNFGAKPFAYPAPTGYSAGLYTELTYATLNSADKGSNVTLTNGNLTTSSSGGQGVRATGTGKSSGKWFWEVKFEAYNGGPVIGVASKAVDHSYPWDDPNNFMFWYYASGTYITKGNVRGSYSTTAGTIGDVVGVALDLDNRTLEFYRNGVAQGKLSLVADTYYPYIADPASGTMRATFNFGQSAFKYAVPAGFNAGYF